VSAISNVLRETISDPQHRFALSVLHNFCSLNCLWQHWEITVRVTMQHSYSEQFIGISQRMTSSLFHKCALGIVFSLEMGTKCQSYALDSNTFRSECSHIWPKVFT